jgi:hypothetical protein
VSYGHIHFDMSMEGLVELHRMFKWYDHLSDELQNFHNEIQGMIERGDMKSFVKQEASWLDV